ncbi:MAG: YitT family protein [Thermotogota bacterium]
MKKTVFKDYFVSVIGVALTAVGLVSFLMPNNIAAGGANGIAIVLNGLFDLPVGILMYFVNFVLFIVSFIFIGKSFGVRSIVCTFMLNFFVDFFDRIIPFPKYTGEDLFIAVFLGIFISAIGMAIAFSVNSSTGGTDILAKISNKYFGLPMGISLLFVDLFIGIAAGSLYDLQVGMYSIISVIMNGLIIDFVMKSLRTNNILTIISNQPDEIINYIFKNLDRGASVIKGQGAYSKKEKDFIYVAVNKRQKHEVIKNINKIDPYAFIIVQETSDVVGYGFGTLKNY